LDADADIPDSPGGHGDDAYLALAERLQRLVRLSLAHVGV
jgi:hypothetical protein